MEKQSDLFSNSQTEKDLALVDAHMVSAASGKRLNEGESRILTSLSYFIVLQIIICSFGKYLIVTDFEKIKMGEISICFSENGSDKNFQNVLHNISL